MMAPAGFWRRCAAWTLDAAVLAPASLLLAWPWLQPAAMEWQAACVAVLGLLGERIGEAAMAGTPPTLLASALLHDAMLRSAVSALHGATWSTVVPVLAVFAALGAAWNVLGERSSWRGSAGKRLLRLQVADRGGQPPGVARSLSRHLAGAASWATLNFGHAMAALPPEHLALHDRLAGTRVLATTSATVPLWARCWLALVAIAAMVSMLWITVAGAAAASAAMNAGLERALY